MRSWSYESFPSALPAVCADGLEAVSRGDAEAPIVLESDMGAVLFESAKPFAIMLTFL